MAVVIGEAAVTIRADASGTAQEIEQEVGPAAEKAGKDAGDALGAKMQLGIAAAGALVGAGFAESLEQAALGDKLAAQLGATGDYAADLGNIAGDVYAGGFGEGLGDVNEALRSVIQSGAVFEDATDAQLTAATESALNLASAFDVDVAGAADAAGRLVQQGLAANATEAFDIITRGFQQGADKGGDFLDSLNEYGTTFAQLGLTGTQATGLLSQGLKAGVMNTDLAADALREMGIRGREGADATADALKSVGLNANDYFEAMQAGGPAAAGALDQALDALRNTEDPAIRAAAATAIVGTQYEDLGDALLQLDPSEATGALGDVEGAAAAMGDTLSDNASANLTSFYRTAQQAFVDLLGGQVVPIVENVVGWLRDNLGPALESVGSFISDNVVPPLQSLAQWLGDNEPLVNVLAYAIGTVLVAALAVWGTRSLIEAGKSIIAWFTTAASSSTSAATQQKSALQVVAGWVLMGVQALIQGIKVAAVWTAQIVASAVTGAASFAVQVARVVGGWVLMGAQSLIQAARMAAAWFIALGPIGWIIAAVIGIVALVIANWETVKNWTIGAWQAIVDWISGAWQWIKDAVSAGIQAIVDWFMNWTILGIVISHWDEIVAFIGEAWESIKSAVSTGLSAVVGFLTGLPGRAWAALSSLGQTLWNLATGAWALFSNAVNAGITGVIGFVQGLPGRVLSALSGFGSLLLGLGGDLIRGLVNGISGAASFVGDVAGNIWRAVKGFINSNVIDKLNGLLEFTIMGVHVNPPDIPRLHSGGVFTTSGGEGLAILSNEERVVTPQQRVIADRLLAGLLGGSLTTAPGVAGTGAGGVTVTNNVTQLPGEDGTVLAARVTQGTVWNLSAGITRRVGVGAEAFA